MKAITCSQCGATIKRIRIRDKYFHCDYCNAVMPIRPEKVVEIPDPPGEKAAKQPSNWEIYQKNRQQLGKTWRKADPEVSGSAGFFDTVEDGLDIRWIVAGVLAMIVIPVFFYLIFPAAEIESGREEQITEVSPSPTPCPILVFAVPLYFEKDQHKIENPELDISKLPTCDMQELKTTIFSDQNNKVGVEVVINPDGEVIEAKAVSGHPFLHAASESAARRSIFVKRDKNQKRLIKFIYVISG